MSAVFTRGAHRMEPVLMSWSGGKDSCMALFALQQTGFEVAGLMTTITREIDRISIHGVRRDLLRQQAAAIGLPLEEVFIPASCSNADYENAMDAALAAYRERCIRTVAFGDLFLEDIRAYRDRLLERNGMRAFYPVWGQDTGEFVQEFIREGFKAVLTCVDLAVLDPSFAGRSIDADLLADLPEGVDPCGENGEFHSFVFDGPNFSRPVSFHIGERVTRGAFCFCDLIPKELWVPTSSEMERQPC